MADAIQLVVVDDEPGLCTMIAEYLGRYGFAVRTAQGAAGLDACLADLMPDLIILDVNMPGENGFSIARRVRAASDVPILMLTAADDVVDRVVGLELGADDYVTKPFDPRELRARIQSILRRATRSQGPDQASAQSIASSERVRFGDMILDLDARRLSGPDGADLKLTAMEFDLLAAFARNPNKVLTRERLLDMAHQRDGEVFDRSIDVRITRIRRKVERDPAHPEMIKTMRGAGYMFVPKSL
jgi:two-component system phosphate regulon response regulator OmpR